MMNIGETIKKLRRERDITQEQLADFLSVSVSAISQWECGRTCPDIAQLPALANVFDVTSDFILGIDIDKKEARIDQIRDEAYQVSKLGKKAEAAEMLRAGLKEFPNSYDLMWSLCDCLCYPQKGETEDEKRNRVAEHTALLEKRVEGSPSLRDKFNATGELCWVYCRAGRKEDAERLANTLPDKWTPIKDNIYRGMATGIEKLSSFKADIFDDITQGCLYMRWITNFSDDDGKPAYTDEEAITIHKKIIAVYEILYEDRDFGSDGQWLGIAHSDIAERYANLGDAENTLYHLEMSVPFHVTADILRSKSETDGGVTISHTSILTCRGEKEDSYTCPYTENQCGEHIKKLRQPRYDFVRNDLRFANVENELRKYAVE